MVQVFPFKFPGHQLSPLKSEGHAMRALILAALNSKEYGKRFLETYFRIESKIRIKKSLAPVGNEERQSLPSMAPLLYGKSYCNRWLHIIYYSYKHTITNHHP